MKNYYVLSNGRVKREANTLYIENEAGQKKPVPIEDVESLYLYGEVDLNTRLLNFLSQKKIPLHVFNYYGFYAGSYYPREYLHSGYLLVHQVSHYVDPEKRLFLARELVRGAAHSLLRNIAYYEKRKGGEEREPAGEIGMEDGPDDTQDCPVLDSPNRNSRNSPILSGVPTDADTEAAVDAVAGSPADANSADTEPSAACPTSSGRKPKSTPCAASRARCASATTRRGAISSATAGPSSAASAARRTTR